MPHTYVIQSVLQQPGPSAGDPMVIITGTVDGTPVQASCWSSIYLSNAASAISAQNFIISLMLAAWTALQSSTPLNAPAARLTITV